MNADDVTGGEEHGQSGARAGDEAPSAVGLRVPGRDAPVPDLALRGALCFDFDGCIVEYHGWKQGHVGKTIPGAIDALKAAKKQGFRVVIFTARTDGIPARWVEDHGLQAVIDEVTNIKPKDAVRFFDDRATHVPTNSTYALSLALVGHLGDHAESSDALRGLVQMITARALAQRDRAWARGLGGSFPAHTPLTDLDAEAAARRFAASLRRTVTA